MPLSPLNYKKVASLRGGDTGFESRTGRHPEPESRLELRLISRVTHCDPKASALYHHVATRATDSVQPQKLIDDHGFIVKPPIISECHGGDTGSTPVRDAKALNQLQNPVFTSARS